MGHAWPLMTLLVTPITAGLAVSSVPRVKLAAMVFVAAAPAAMASPAQILEVTPITVEVAVTNACRDKIVATECAVVVLVVAAVAAPTMTFAVTATACRRPIS